MTKILTAFIVVILVLPILYIHPVFAAKIFEDGFETGDFSKWTVKNGGYVTSGDAHHGTYKAVLNASSQYDQARFTNIDHCFFRAYVMFKSFPTTGLETPILGVYNTSGIYMAEARVGNFAGTLKWRLRFYNGTTHYTVTSEQQKPVLDTWYCVEVEGKSNTTTGAESRIYINGNELTDVSQTGKNNNYLINCAYIWESVTGGVTQWYDDVIVGAGYIGPECTLTVNVAGSGSVAKVPDQTFYSWGTNVTLTANPTIGWSFDHWSGDASGTVNPTTVTMTDNMAVIATFRALGPPAVLVHPATTDAILGGDYTVYINITNVVDMYAWEFQLNYDPALLDLTSAAIVPGGLNEPTQTFYDLTDEIAGHLWWAVSTKYPTLTGISYFEHAIFQMTFHTIGVGTSNIELYGIYLANSDGAEMTHTVTNGSVTVSAPDLTVSSIAVLNLGCSIYKNDTDALGNPYYYPVEVEIANTGDADATAFYVKLEIYWINGSITEASEEISVASLAQGTATTVGFTSLFHPMQTGYYRLVVTVDSRNSVEESNESNNALTKEDVKVTVIGDLNGDGAVDILDGVRISLAWDSTPSDGWWNIKADINHNGIVSILDATKASLHWGETW
jgi:hypothetical protein